MNNLAPVPLLVAEVRLDDLPVYRSRRFGDRLWAVAVAVGLSTGGPQPTYGLIEVIAVDFINEPAVADHGVG